MEQSKRSKQSGQAIIASVTRRLMRQVATIPGTGNTIQLVADSVLNEWATWLVDYHPDIWSEWKSSQDATNTKITERCLKIIKESAEFRAKLLGNESRDVMRGYMLRWVYDEIEKKWPLLVTDRQFPTYLKGV